MRDERGRFLPGNALAKGVPYSSALADEIIDWLTEGKSLKSFCEQPGKPSRKCVYEWIDQDRNGFAERYETARRRAMESWADELDELASAELGSESMPAVQARKTQIHTRQWLMERLHPAAYGQRVAYEHRHAGAGVVVFVPSNNRLIEDAGGGPVIDGTAQGLLEAAASDGQSDAEDEKPR